MLRLAWRVLLPSSPGEQRTATLLPNSFTGKLMTYLGLREKTERKEWGGDKGI